MTEIKPVPLISALGFSTFAVASTAYVYLDPHFTAAKYSYDTKIRYSNIALGFKIVASSKCCLQPMGKEIRTASHIFERHIAEAFREICRTWFARIQPVGGRIGYLI